MRPPARRRFRVLRATSGALVVVVAVWLGWAYAVIQTPRTDEPAKVDAVLVLGGLSGSQRTEKALAMAGAGLTRNIVLSLPRGSGDQLARNTCAQPPAGIQVICFRPDPSTTQGEAEEIRRLAAKNGWQSLAVVTSTFHISRARLIVGRCFRGRLLMVRSDEHIGVRHWAYNYLYQTGGYLKAWTSPGC